MPILEETVGRVADSLRRHFMAAEDIDAMASMLDSHLYLRGNHYLDSELAGVSVEERKTLVENVLLRGVVKEGQQEARPLLHFLVESLLNSGDQKRPRARERKEKLEGTYTKPELNVPGFTGAEFILARCLAYVPRENLQGVVDSQDGQGNSILHHIVRNIDPCKPEESRAAFSLLKLVLMAGAEIKIKNNENQSPADILLEKLQESYVTEKKKALPNKKVIAFNQDLLMILAVNGVRIEESSKTISLDGADGAHGGPRELWVSQLPKDYFLQNLVTYNNHLAYAVHHSRRVWKDKADGREGEPVYSSGHETTVIPSDAAINFAWQGEPWKQTNIIRIDDFKFKSKQDIKKFSFLDKKDVSNVLQTNDSAAPFQVTTRRGSKFYDKWDGINIVMGHSAAILQDARQSIDTGNVELSEYARTPVVPVVLDASSHDPARRNLTVGAVHSTAV